jgi:hypothetical protein
MAKKALRQIRTSANYSPAASAEKNTKKSEAIQGQSEPLAQFGQGFATTRCSN